MKKKYCKQFKKNLVEDDSGKIHLVDNFCKHYRGSKRNIESCYYKCAVRG